MSAQSGSIEGGLGIGEYAPSFEATDFDGSIVRPEDFHGQRFILTFVSPGCRACAGAIQALNAIQQDEQYLRMLVVSGADREANRAYATEREALMPVLSAAPSVERELYRVPGVPFSFVIDEANTIRAKGFVNYREDILQMLTVAFTAVPTSG